MFRIYLALASCFFAAGPLRADPTVVIHNARVVTVDKAFRLAEAVAIEGERIVAVGGNDECLKLAGPKTKRIDARGRMVMPGLYDSHSHALGASTSEFEQTWPPYESIAQLQQYLREETRKRPKGAWIVLRYAFPTRLKEGRLPTREEIDEAARDHPVLWDAYPLAVVNSAALKISNVTRDTKDPLPGTLDRDPKTGEPTGVLRSATSVLKGLPSDKGPTPEQRKKAHLHLLKLYNEYGITAIAERGLGPSGIDHYRSLAKSGELTVRVNCTRVTSAGAGDRDADACRKKLKSLAGDKGQYGPTGVGDDWVRIGPLKVYMDGGMLSGTAYMREPWGVGRTYLITDPSYRGQLRSDLAGLRTLYRAAAKEGWQLTAHTAGEAAMDELLNVYEGVQKETDITKRRMLVTHANFQSEENLKRCRALGVCADLQPAWFYLDGDSLLRTLGPKRTRWFLPLKSWLDYTVIGGGSDHMTKLHPEASINPWSPWLGMWVALARKTTSGQVIEPDERLTREQAIRFYTINNAYLHFQEEQIGSLEKGKYADLIMLDRDVLTCPVDDVRTTRVLLTMIAGRIVHER